MATFPFSAVIYQQKYSFRDAKGNVSVMKFFVQTNASSVINLQTDLVAFSALITPLTNAALQNASGLDSRYGVAQYGAHASGGAYESVIEKAVLVFQDNTGQLHRFQIPAPKVSIFKADKVTVDPGNTDVAAFVNNLVGPFTHLGQIVTRQNVPFANFMGGVYRSARIRRRTSILTLEPDLTPSLPAE